MIGSAEDALDRPGGGFCFCQLSGPANAGGWVASGAGGLELKVANSFFARGIAPVVPTFGTDYAIHLAMDKADRSARPPGPP